MFIVRNYSRYFYLRCSIRYQSSTSNDLTKIESSTEIEKKSTLNTSLWATSETNRLIDYLSMRIQKIGPITVADFMQEAWKNPKYVEFLVLFSFILYSFTFDFIRVLTIDMKSVEKLLIHSFQKRLLNYMLR